jgi:hypothetical protein
MLQSEVPIIPNKRLNHPPPNLIETKLCMMKLRFLLNSKKCAGTFNTFENKNNGRIIQLFRYLFKT